MNLTARAGALLLAWALGLYGVLGGLPLQPAHELHLLLGTHYQYDVFGLWTTRWSEGQSVAGHAPLVHVLLGLLARVPGVGVERGWAALTSLGPPLLAYAAGRFGETLSTKAAGDACAWLAAVNPLCLVFALPYAQLPFVVGAACALLAAAEWTAAIRAKSLGALVGATALAVCAVCAHHAAVTVLAPAALVACVAHPSSMRPWLAVIASGLLAAGLATWTLQPLLEAVAHVHVAAPSKVVSQGSVSGPVIAGFVAWSSFIGVALGGRAARALAATALGCVVLSRLHLVPGIADDKWLWAGFTLALLTWGVAFEPSAAITPARRALALTATVVSLGLISAWELGRPWDDAYGRRNRALAEVVTAFNQPEAGRYRYFTIGLRSARYELARRVPPASLDTGLPWYQASVLAGTTWSSLDELDLSSASGAQAFRRVLSEAAAHHVRWVVSADSRAAPMLTQAGFGVRSAWAGDLTLWSRDEVPPLEEALAAPVRSTAWSLVPLGCVLVSALALWRRRPVAAAAN